MTGDDEKLAPMLPDLPPIVVGRVPPCMLWVGDGHRVMIEWRESVGGDGTFDVLVAGRGSLAFGSDVRVALVSRMGSRAIDAIRPAWAKSEVVFPRVPAGEYELRCEVQRERRPAPGLREVPPVQGSVASLRGRTRVMGSFPCETLLAAEPPLGRAPIDEWDDEWKMRYVVWEAHTGLRITFTTENPSFAGTSICYELTVAGVEALDPQKSVASGRLRFEQEPNENCWVADGPFDLPSVPSEARVSLRCSIESEPAES